MVILEQRSALMTANLVLRITDRKVAVATMVRYEHRAASTVWRVAGLLHRRIVPFLLKHAAAEMP